MTLNEKQNFTQQFETIIYQLANLMFDTVKVTLNTLDEYHQLSDENSNQNRIDDMPFKPTHADDRLPSLQQINMYQNEKIQNALELCDKLDHLESILWDRYGNEFLTLIEQQDMDNPAIDDQQVNCPF